MMNHQDEDRSAFETLFFTYKDDVYKYAFLHLWDDDSAADIVQEVFLKLWNKRGELDPHQNIRSYLYTITRHTVLQELRKRSLFTKFTNHAQYVNPGAINCTEEQQAFHELHELYQQAISTLSEKRKEIYQLSNLENLSNQEIAEYLSISPNTVRDQLVKARKHIRSYISAKGKYVLPTVIFIENVIF